MEDDDGSRSKTCRCSIASCITRFVVGRVVVIDDELPSLDEATSSVDALVSDELQGPLTRSPLVPAAEAGPSLPPGFGPHGHPSVASKPGPAPSRPRSANIVPALPRFSALGLEYGTVTPEQTPRKATHSSALAVEHKLAKGVPSRARGGQSRGSAALQDEDFPALNTPRARETQPASPAISSVTTPKGTPAPKKPADKMSEKAPEKAVMSPIMAPAPFTETSSTKHGIENANALKLAVGPAEESTKSEVSTDLSAALPQPRPLSAGTASSPIQRAAPRSIRVMPTARTEGAALPSPAHSVVSKSVSLPYIPDTPGSEMVSDTASVLSASVSASRAGSPPPSRIGSTGVRSTTKSQQRKQRKEALKQETKGISEVPKADPEEHAPVVGRKKKQKKERAKAAASQQRLDTAPEAAAPEARLAVKSVVQETARDELPEKAETKPRASPQKKSFKGKDKAVNKGKGKEEKEAPATAALQPSPPPPAEPAPPPPPSSPAGTEKAYPSPASVFAEIRNSMWTAAIDKLLMLKPLASSLSRQEHGSATDALARGKSGYCKDCSCKCGEIHDDDLAALRAGKPVRKQLHVDGSRMLITPNGDCIRGLSPDEEDAFLDLQAAVAATADNPGAFVAPRHQPGSGAFSLIKGRAVPNGRPNIFPTTTQPQPQDPIGKLQREDALSYINQYVLPRLNLGAGSMGLPKGASPMRDSAAASLNSLAPYFYGPDAAAGVGIYSAPDGARAMHDFSSPAAAPVTASSGTGSGDDGTKMAGSSSGVGGMPLMSVKDAETALATARKETDKLEKGLNAVIKRNKRLLLGGGN